MADMMSRKGRRSNGQGEMKKKVNWCRDYQRSSWNRIDYSKLF